MSPTTEPSQPDAASDHTDPAAPPAELFDRAELRQFSAEDAEAGRNIGRILVGGFIYSVLAGGLAAYWTMTQGLTPKSIILTVALPAIVLISISVGIGWGSAMMGDKDTDEHPAST